MRQDDTRKAQKCVSMYNLITQCCVTCLFAAESRRPAVNDPGMWHTYTDAAARLGVSVESIRHKVRRKSLQAATGNDGKPRVWIPDTWPAAAGREQAGRGRPNVVVSEDVAGRGRPDLAAAGHNLEADWLRSEIDRERADRARERTESEARHQAQLGRLTEQVRAERALWLERIDVAELRAERVEEKLDRVLDQLLQQQSRPWWRRWLGLAVAMLLVF